MDCQSLPGNVGLVVDQACNSGNRRRIWSWPQDIPSWCGRRDTTVLGSMALGCPPSAYQDPTSTSTTIATSTRSATMEHPTIIPVIAFLIIDRLGKLSTDSGAQSTSTAASKKRIIDKAQRALLDPSIDQRDLFREFKMLIRTIYLEQQVAQLEGAANRRDFLRDIGDWAAAILV